MEGYVSWKIPDLEERLFKTCSKELRELIEIIVSHKGLIFGGSLRDLLAGDNPGDLDIHIYPEDSEGFLTELNQMKAKVLTLTSCKDGIERHHLKVNGYTLDIFITYANIYLMVPDLDLDVNGLVYAGNAKFYLRGDVCTEKKILALSELISKKMARIVNYSWYSIEDYMLSKLTKLRNRGWKIEDPEGLISLHIRINQTKKRRMNEEVEHNLDCPTSSSTLV